MVGIFFLLVLLTLILIFWPRKTVEEELAGSTAKKVSKPVFSFRNPIIFILIWSCFNLLKNFIFDIFQQIEVDELIIPKTVLFVFICIFAAVAFVFLVLHWMEPVYSPALTSRKTYAFWTVHHCYHRIVGLQTINIQLSSITSWWSMDKLGPLIPGCQSSMP